MKFYSTLRLNFVDSKKVRLVESEQEYSSINEAFFHTSVNLLAALLPQDAQYEAQLRVIHVPTTARGHTLTIAMDGESDQALAYLE